MFTGLIQAVGRVEEVLPAGGDVRLRVSVGALAFERVALGESIAVSGCCLTVVAFDEGSFSADVSNESLQCTGIGRWRPGTAVNLERAMSAQDRFGGHIVSGHVDGVGAVRSVEDDGRAQRWWFDAPAALLRYIAVKGSIAVDGVSLTVNAVDAGGFAVALIPHTVSHTAFSATAVGDVVHLEIDTVARYVARLLEFKESA